MLILAIILLAVGFYLLEVSRKLEGNNVPPTTIADQLPEGSTVFSGTVNEIDVGCYADGICKINVDGKWVEFGRGWYQGPSGQFIGFSNIDDISGKMVEVRVLPAEFEGYDYTILGDERLYIKAIN